MFRANISTMQKLLATSIFVLHFCAMSFSQETQYDFFLISTSDGFRLESCIPLEKYNPRLIIPGISDSRKVIQVEAGSPPIQVIGSKWENECLIVEYTDSELPDQDWIELIEVFSVLKKDQINLIHKN